MPIITYAGYQPVLAENVFLAPSAYVIGRVSIGSLTGIWFNTVVRGDMDGIVIGEESNIQDNVTVHIDEGVPTHIGNKVTVGHNAVLHGCTIEDGALIGMSAVISNNVVIGKDSLIAAGSLVAPRTEIPPRSLVMGVPGKVVRTLEEDQTPVADGMYRRYINLAQNYREDNVG